MYQIRISVIMLWQYLGVASIIGVSSAFIFIPANLFISKKIRNLQLTKQKHQDSRIKMMNEILNGVKVIKFYGWELSFKDIVGDIRITELDYLKKMSYLSSVTSFLWLCAPLIITIISFGSFLLLNDASAFTANVAFVSLSLFNILRFPLTVLPGILAAMISAKVSLTRIQTHLLRDEINKDDISYEDIQGVSVRVENVSLGWDVKEKFLKGVNLEVQKGKLVAVVGQVGSGKSSLLSGLLG